MSLPRLLLFLYPFLIVVAVLAQPEFRSYSCSNEAGNYTSNSAYKENLDTLLSSFSSSDAIDYGFYNSSAGQDADRVNAIGLCRGDVLPDACRSCLNDSRLKLTNLCPNQKAATGWYDNCMLRYSNAFIFGTSQTSPSVYIWNTQNASDVEDFNRALGNLMASLRSEAAAGDWRYKFATGQANVTSFENIYGLMQCTPDLSEMSCSNCLEGATNEIQTCCDGKIEGWIIKPSCNLRFGKARFYTFTAGNAPPQARSPPPPPATAPPPSADLAPPPLTNTTSTQGNKISERVILLIIVPTAFVLLMLLTTTFIFCIIRRRQKIIVGTGDEDENVNNKSLQFDLATVKAATDNFSDANKLGQGGFGPVYKGKLSDGQEIAVKRLSSGSGQGEQEFKNEVILVAKLQHRNLVRLLGFCLEERERLLIYEFLPRTSLDKFIFDPIKRAYLGWEKRYNIIEGIARGLLYLHEDSQLRIIHRDLKASNILLDVEMNPKISDFGMARLFIVDQSQGNTSRIVGTYGYMAPEYARHGRFSVKTDVYSFGVLLLEIVSGQSNNSFGRESSDDQNVGHLLSYAWRKWREGSAANLVDPAMRVRSTSNEIMRCIHIGLLCVQENEADRPTMASVVLMLNSYSLSLPLASRPAFFIHSTTNSGLPPEQGDDNSTAADFTVNEASISELSPR